MIEIRNMRAGRPISPWDVRVDRANKILGNKFYMSSESQRDKVCGLYADWFKTKVEAENDNDVKTELERLKAIYELYGKLHLWCFCAPKRCHAETIRDWLLNQSKF